MSDASSETSSDLCYVNCKAKYILAANHLDDALASFRSACDYMPDGVNGWIGVTETGIINSIKKLNDEAWRLLGAEVSRRYADDGLAAPQAQAPTSA